MELISSKDFGKLLSDKSDSEYRRLRDNYDDFLEQPLKLEMFVPCDEEGDILEEPTNYEKRLLNMMTEYNDEVYTGNIENLFDNKEFNSLSVCTFVSSIKYFFNKVNDFDKIELLLGIEDGENAQNCRYFSSKI